MKNHRIMGEFDFDLSDYASFLYCKDPEEYINYYILDNHKIICYNFEFDYENEITYVVYRCEPIDKVLCLMIILVEIYKGGKAKCFLARQLDDKLDIDIGDELEKTRFEYMVNEGIDIGKLAFPGHQDFLQRFVDALLTRLENEAKMMEITNEDI